ncbi:MAG: urease accessory protein UreD, partial [Pseudomonadota bacterium]
LINTAGGLTGGDVMRADLTVDGGAAAFTTQAAEKLYRASAGVAEVATTLSVAAGAQAVVALGGGAAIDLAKAVAGLAPATRPMLDHLEVVGGGLPLEAEPLPVVALPTTAGTGAEVTRNAVIGVPAHRRKVSLRDPRLMPRLAIVDPALSSGAPRAVTLASGLDAVTQVIEPYLSARATAMTDALVAPAIPLGLSALVRLMRGEDRSAREAMAYVGLVGGLALSNAGLGAVHGFAGVLGGRTGAAHGAICGRLLPFVLAMNERLTAEAVGDASTRVSTSASARASARAAARLPAVRAALAGALGCAPGAAFTTLAAWARDQGLASLAAMGHARRASATGGDGDPLGEDRAVAEASLAASSMKANPVALGVEDLMAVLATERAEAEGGSP